jgi:hypothetical protein
MSDVLIKAALIFAVWIVARVLLERVTAPARELHLTLFTPWRRDGWPTGVQEDDDARFAWGSRPAGDHGETIPGSGRLVARPEAMPPPAQGLEAGAMMEDTRLGVEQLTKVSRRGQDRRH